MNDAFLAVAYARSGRADQARVIGLLNVAPDQEEYTVVVAPGIVTDPLLNPRAPSTEVRILPRSTMQVLCYLANGVEVPPEHFVEGTAVPTVGPGGQVIDGRQLTEGIFEVHTFKGHKPPPNTYVAVKGRGYWYDIDGRDQASKSTLMIMLQLGRLDFGNQKPAGPFLTLPVGR
jgi:hypothetical protein